MKCDKRLTETRNSKMVRNATSVKAEKLKRMPLLRVLNALGLFAWKETAYDYAEQKLRLLHPLSWIFIVVTFFVGGFVEGFPGVAKELKQSFKHDTVWF
jgi:nicotinamide riboside transporter PnuC